jgi:nucleoside-diphosphate-sugar epimerase
LLGTGEQRWSFAYIVDVVKAHLTALDKGKLGEEYLLGGDNRSLNDFFRVLADVSRIRRPVRHISFRVGKLMGSIELMRARAFGHYPRITPGVVEIFKRDWVYSSSKATRDLGYWVAPLEEGLKKTLEKRPASTAPAPSEARVR